MVSHRHKKREAKPLVVTFCGHTDWYGTSTEISQLHSVIRQLILEGADTFFLGGYGRFDDCAAATVRDLKAEFPNIRSLLVIPYPDREYCKNLYDGSLFPPIEKTPPRFAISKRNEWMIGQADVVVSGVNRDWGGAYAALRYAKRKKKRIVYIGKNALRFSVF